MKKVAGIYKITSPSGKVYIGQSWDIHNRWRLHRADFNRGRGNPHLVNSFRKYGVDTHTFEIIYQLPANPPNNTQYNLDIWEQFLMDESRAEHVHLFNMREAGSNGRPSKESIAKMVATRRSRDNFAVSENALRKRRAALKGRPGRPHTEETKRLLADLARGKVQSEETKERNRQSQLGRKHSPETKAKIALAHMGRKRPDLAARNRERARRAAQ